jgi:16S rRNA (guanine(966)-N(2))-methyltransferase RsmD
VREALFDILGARVHDASFLDLYAGTGAVGVEALSRGARRVVFVDDDPGAARLIEENLALLESPGAAEILTLGVAASLSTLKRRKERFQVVFLDPPYDDAVPEPVLAAAAGLVVPGGIVVVEHAARRPPAPAAVLSLRPGRVYRYGDTSLTVLHREAGPEGG